VHNYGSIEELGREIHEQSRSPVDLVRAQLSRIGSLNPTLNAFITVLADHALEQAKDAEAEIKAGHWRGPLHGIPFGVKDFYDTVGVRTTAASERLMDRVPTHDAVSVAKLKNAGAIIIGKTNMHELGMGTTSLVSYFGAVRNPRNVAHIAGGSSGGSAAAVASGMCCATIDTDAVGSCRLPASCCGVVGFKATYGLIDNGGILEGEKADPAILWLSHLGITTRRVEDTAIVLDALAEQGDRTRAVGFRAALANIRTVRIGVADNFDADDEVGGAFEEAVETLREFGYCVRSAVAPLENPGFNTRNIEADRERAGERFFSNADLLVLPTTTTTTPAVEEASADPLMLSPNNTLFANYYGLPAISVPCGNDTKGLPLGLQIVGKPWGEDAVLQLAYQYQNATARSVERSAR
jgi:aspartyl-tRNA(Asn)/glutamyl-tRNA(Gln) amidotransferase subunit A